MDPRAVDMLINNFAAAAYHLKDQYADYALHGEKNKYPSGAQNYSGWDQGWPVQNSLASYSPGQKNYRPPPGTPEAGLRMVPFDNSGKVMQPGAGNPAYVEEWHRNGPGPTNWQKVMTWGQPQQQ